MASSQGISTSKLTPISSTATQPLPSGTTKESTTPATLSSSTTTTTTRTTATSKKQNVSFSLNTNNQHNSTKSTRDNSNSILRKNQYFNHHRNHEPKDYQYTQKLAQRSVARAALHLGMESMTQDTLDVLADALLCYMEKVGSFMSHVVEKDGCVGDGDDDDDAAAQINQSNKKRGGSTSSSSLSVAKLVGGNRWSGHVNVLDVLHAIECCTSHTVNQVDFSEDHQKSLLSHQQGMRSIITTPHEQQNHHIMNNNFEGLAEFLFGKDWSSIGVRSNTIDNQNNANKPMEGEGTATNKEGANNDPSSTNTTLGTTNNQRVMGSKSIGKTLINKTITSSVSSTVTSTTKAHEGKQLPSSSPSTTSIDNDQNKKKGWNAPYPDEVPKYPLRRHIQSFDTLVKVDQACRDPFPLEQYRTNSKSKNDNNPMKQQRTGDSDKNNNNEKKIKSSLASMYDQHQIDMEERLGNIPHDVFQDGHTTFWGETPANTGISKGTAQTNTSSTNNSSSTIQQNLKNDEKKKDGTDTNKSNSNKRKRDNDDQDDPSTKRSKLSTGDTWSEVGNETTNVALPPYVPRFLPPFPPAHTYCQTSSSALGVKSMYTSQSKFREVLPSSSISMYGNPSSSSLGSKFDAINQTTNVKSALVSLGQNVRKSYWGAMVDDGTSSTTSKQGNTLKSIQLKTAKIKNLATSTLGDTTTGSTVGSAQEMMNKEVGGNASVVPVKPMSKASSVRTSRILEGSMDHSSL